MLTLSFLTFLLILLNKIIFFQSMMSLKEKKDMDDQFKKVQKPWAKLLNKVNKTKQDYHNACKAEKTAINQERNASGDSSLSPDQVSSAHVSPLFVSRHPKLKLTLTSNINQGDL